MHPFGYFASIAVSMTGLSVGLIGMLENAPFLAGGGFAVTAGLQLWTMGKLGPINIRMAVLEERVGRIEDDLKNRSRGNRHQTPPIE